MHALTTKRQINKKMSVLISEEDEQLNRSLLSELHPRSQERELLQSTCTDETVDYTGKNDNIVEDGARLLI